MFKNLRNTSIALLAAYGLNLFSPGAVLGDSLVSKETGSEYTINVKSGDTLWWLMYGLGVKEEYLANAVNQLVDEQPKYSTNQEFLKRIRLDTKKVVRDPDTGEFIVMNGSDQVMGDNINPNDIFYFTDEWLNKYGANREFLESIGAREVEGGYAVEVTEDVLNRLEALENNYKMLRSDVDTLDSRVDTLETKVNELSKIQGFGSLTEEKETKKRSLGEYIGYGLMIPIAILIGHGIYDACKDHNGATGGRGGRSGGDQIR